MKKSHVLLLGSLLIFCGIAFLAKDYLMKIKNQIYSDMLIKMSFGETDVLPENNQFYNPVDGSYNNDGDYTIDYSKYYGVLEIPKIWLKRGFFNTNSKYNNVDMNVSLVGGSLMPGNGNGRMILMAHSGDSYISYFAYLYKLEVGDECFVTFEGQSHRFVIKDIYNVEKNGFVSIKTNPNAYSLVLITCTKDSDTEQTIYIAEEE